MHSIDYTKELNAAQLEAVQSTEGPHLVIAGAGSGKTRVLVYRVAYLVEKGIAPDHILLLTFTRKAATEMLRRATLLLDERCQRVAGGTFHSFANMCLRKYGRQIGLSPHFTIIDETDAQDSINLIRTQLGFNKTDKRFPRKNTLHEVISKSINKAAKLKDVLYDEYPQFMEYEAEILRIGGEYARYKQQKSLLDYDDLLVYLEQMLLKHEDIRTLLARTYRYIMVDEYQDTNKLQAHIVCLLAASHKNVMVVGDDSQSIYSFRGANFKNIIDFPRLFTGAKVITLEENYRSTQPILDLTNEVISNSKEKFEKHLFTKKQEGGLPLYVETHDESGQSKYIAQKILELREEGVGLGEIAVLFRSGWHSNDLEIELAGRNIPFVKYGGQKFVEAAHIKDVVALLRIVYNVYDAVSWYRVLLLMRGVGPKTAQRIIDEIITAKKGLEADAAVMRKPQELLQLVGLLKEASAHKVELQGLLEAFLKFYQPLLKDKYDDFNKRINDLDSLQRIAARYDSLEDFLTDMALDPPERAILEAGRINTEEAPLTLTTIHSAKGLEWHTVFLIYAAEGHLPSYRSLEDADAIEEERRLFYVATTRARENLFILKPNIDRSPRSYFDAGGSVFTQPSRFLTESSLLEKFVKVQQMRPQAGIDDLEVDDLLTDEPRRDKKFLDMLDSYFDEP